MKKILTICLIALFLSPMKANAFSLGDFFRALFGLSKTTTPVETVKEDVETTLSDIKKSTTSIEKEMQENFLAVVTKLSAEKDVILIKEKLNAANALSDATEKSQEINKIMEDYTTYLKNNKLELLLILKTMSEEEKNELIKNINDLNANAQKYYELSEKGINETSKIIRTSYNDADLNKVLEETNTYAKQLVNDAKAILAMTAQAKILATLSGLKF